MTSRVVLLGHRISYSASPAMLNAAFAASGIEARYGLRDVPAETLDGAVAKLRDAKFLGANVTQPHKLPVLDLLDEVALDAERIGAVNTIVRIGDRLIGHNTDLPALAAELPRSVRHAVVLGAGGASRAVVMALTDAGAGQISVVTRSDWHRIPELLLMADLLVNATPIGTASDESPVPRELLRPDLAVLDLVYRPSPTRLVRDARAAGAEARDGSGVLLRQAAASFELWTKQAAPLEIMREALAAELGAAAGV